MPGRRSKSGPGERRDQGASPFELDILNLDADPDVRLVSRPMEGGGRVEYEMWDGEGLALRFGDWRRAAGGEIRVFDGSGFLTIEMNIGEPRRARPALG
jgi:hypothetical protein